MPGACQRIGLILLMMVANLAYIMAGLPDPYKFSLLSIKDGLLIM